MQSIFIFLIYLCQWQILMTKIVFLENIDSRQLLNIILFVGLKSPNVFFWTIQFFLFLHPSSPSGHTKLCSLNRKLSRILQAMQNKVSNLCIFTPSQNYFAYFVYWKKEMERKCGQIFRQGTFSEMSTTPSSTAKYRKLLILLLSHFILCVK